MKRLSLRNEMVEVHDFKKNQPPSLRGIYRKPPKFNKEHPPPSNVNMLLTGLGKHWEYTLTSYAPKASPDTGSGHDWSKTPVRVFDQFRCGLSEFPMKIK